MKLETLLIYLWWSVNHEIAHHQNYSRHNLQLDKYYRSFAVILAASRTSDGRLKETKKTWNLPQDSPRKIWNLTCDWENYLWPDFTYNSISFLHYYILSNYKKTSKRPTIQKNGTRSNVSRWHQDKYFHSSLLINYSVCFARVLNVCHESLKRGN